MIVLSNDIEAYSYADLTENEEGNIRKLDFRHPSKFMDDDEYDDVVPLLPSEFYHIPRLAERGPNGIPYIDDSTILSQWESGDYCLKLRRQGGDVLTVNLQPAQAVSLIEMLADNVDGVQVEKDSEKLYDDPDGLQKSEGGSAE